MYKPVTAEKDQFIKRGTHNGSGEEKKSVHVLQITIKCLALGVTLDKNSTL